MRFSGLQMILITVAVFIAATGGLFVLSQRADHPGDFVESASFSEGEIFETAEQTSPQGTLSREGLSAARDVPVTPGPSQPSEPSEPPLDVNRASRDDFLRVKGLSPQLVDAIILFREEGGDFKSLADLQNVPGITAPKFDEIRPFLVIEGAAVETARTDAINPDYQVIPLVSEESSARETTPTSGDTAVRGSEEGDLININTASINELTVLPGIGPKIAERIVEYREQTGPFRRIDNITRVKGIGPKLFEKIKDRITVGN